SLPVSESLQIDEAVPQWRFAADTMGLSRDQHYLTMLPTGEVIATGGQGKSDTLNSDPEDDLPRKRPEIWDPNYMQGNTVGYWYAASGVAGEVQLDSEQVTRAYHSSVSLLPDGRLLVGGGLDEFPVEAYRSADQYSPPYLFRPTSLGGGAAFRPRLYGAQDH